MSTPPLRMIALETSGMLGSVAALLGAKQLLQRELNPEQRSAQSLAPTIRQVLAEVGWQPSDVELVAVTTGPGSFTGLRVGVTTAKTLAYVLGANVVGVNTLEALAQQAPCQGQQLFAIIDAGRQELYVGEFVNSEQGWQPTSDGSIVAIETWLASLPHGAIVTGPALAKLAQQLPPHVIPTPPETWKLMANAVGQVARRHFLAGGRDDPFQLVPFYLRRSAAEEKADQAERTLNPK